MSKTTTNLGLIKPEKSDNYSVDVMANNMDIIDAKLGKITIDSSGNIVGNIVGTASSLNTTVNVSVSTTTISLKYGTLVLCPYVPGVKYTGKIKANGVWNGNYTSYATVAILSSSGWTTQTFNGELSINNALYVIAYSMHGLEPPVYLPIFS